MDSSDLLKKFLKGIQKDDSPSKMNLRNLKKWENQLKRVSEVASPENLMKCVVHFIDFVVNYASTQSPQNQHSICENSFGLLKDIVTPELKNIFVRHVTRRIFDIVIEETAASWCMKRELLKVFNCCISSSDKFVRKRTVQQLSDMYIYKMVDSISTYGDYDLQVQLIETVFRMYGQEVINNRLKDLIPESQELSQSFAEINDKTFDEDVRVFLINVNRISGKVFSIICSSIKIGEVVCRPVMDNIDGTWVDFNVWESTITWYCATSTFSRDDKDEDDEVIWSLITLFVSDIECVNIHSSADNSSFILYCKLSGPCLSSSEYQNILDKANNLSILVQRTKEADILISDILPRLFGKKIQQTFKKDIRKKVSTKSDYKSLNIKFKRRPKSVASGCKSDISCTTSFMDPMSGKSTTTRSEDSASSKNETSRNRHSTSSRSSRAEVITIDSSTEHTNYSSRHLPVILERDEKVFEIADSDDTLSTKSSNTHETSQIHIFSGRCSGSNVRYSQASTSRDRVHSTPIKVSTYFEKKMIDTVQQSSKVSTSEIYETARDTLESQRMPKVSRNTIADLPLEQSPSEAMDSQKTVRIEGNKLRQNEFENDVKSISGSSRTSPSNVLTLSNKFNLNNNLPSDWLLKENFFDFPEITEDLDSLRVNFDTGNTLESNPKHHNRSKDSASFKVSTSNKENLNFSSAMRERLLDWTSEKQSNVSLDFEDKLVLTCEAIKEVPHKKMSSVGNKGLEKSKEKVSTKIDNEDQSVFNSLEVNIHVDRVTTGKQSVNLDCTRSASGKEENRVIGKQADEQRSKERTVAAKHLSVSKVSRSLRKSNETSRQDKHISTSREDSGIRQNVKKISERKKNEVENPVNKHVTVVTGVEEATSTCEKAEETVLFDVVSKKKQTSAEESEPLIHKVDKSLSNNDQESHLVKEIESRKNMTISERGQLEVPKLTRRKSRRGLGDIFFKKDISSKENERQIQNSEDHKVFGEDLVDEEKELSKQGAEAAEQTDTTVGEKLTKRHSKTGPEEKRYISSKGNEKQIQNSESLKFFDQDLVNEKEGVSKQGGEDLVLGATDTNVGETVNRNVSSLDDKIPINVSAISGENDLKVSINVDNNLRKHKGNDKLGGLKHSGTDFNRNNVEKNKETSRVCSPKSVIASDVKEVQNEIDKCVMEEKLSLSVIAVKEKKRDKKSRGLDKKLKRKGLKLTATSKKRGTSQKCPIPIDATNFSEDDTIPLSEVRKSLLKGKIVTQEKSPQKEGGRAQLASNSSSMSVPKKKDVPASKVSENEKITVLDQTVKDDRELHVDERHHKSAADALDNQNETPTGLSAKDHNNQIPKSERECTLDENESSESDEYFDENRFLADLGAPKLRIDPESAFDNLLETTKKSAVEKQKDSVKRVTSETREEVVFTKPFSQDCNVKVSADKKGFSEELVEQPESWTKTNDILGESNIKPSTGEVIHSTEDIQKIVEHPEIQRETSEVLKPVEASDDIVIVKSEETVIAKPGTETRELKSALKSSKYIETTPTKDNSDLVVVEPVSKVTTEMETPKTSDLVVVKPVFDMETPKTIEKNKKNVKFDGPVRTRKSEGQGASPDYTKDLNQTASTTLSGRKRRKLYDPDDLSHLNSMLDDVFPGSNNGTMEKLCESGKEQELFSMKNLPDVSINMKQPEAKGKLSPLSIKKKDAKKMLHNQSSIFDNIAVEVDSIAIVPGIVPLKERTEMSTLVKSPARKDFKMMRSKKNISKNETNHKDIKKQQHQEKKKYIKPINLNTSLINNGEKSHLKSFFENMLDSFREEMGGESIIEKLNKNRIKENKSENKRIGLSVSNRKTRESKGNQKRKTNLGEHKKGRETFHSTRIKQKTVETNHRRKTTGNVSFSSSSPSLRISTRLSQRIEKEKHKYVPGDEHMREANNNLGPDVVEDKNLRKRPKFVNDITFAQKDKRDDTANIKRKINIISDIQIKPGRDEVPSPPKKMRIFEGMNLLNETNRNNLSEIHEMDYANNTRSSHVSTPSILVSKRAPSWQGVALLDDQIVTLTSTEYLKKYLVFFFYPLDFGTLPYVCDPTEIIGFNERIEDFRNINVEIVACSIDSYFTHRAWVERLKGQGSLNKLKIPLLSDANHRISKSFRIYSDKLGHTVRGIFIIDPQGVIIQEIKVDLLFRIDVDIIYNLLQAVQSTK
ncbi:uncharacterized protein isoform X3 [Leptinotarsa decemlineata]|uniref:uncharacterized protein isoform X3 n=1 Tax=Leptinotarsa decemlineata TaxID=7539 RepID=UPI003D30A542